LSYPTAKERPYGSVRGAAGNRCPYRDKSLSRDVDEKKGTWLKPEVENGEGGVLQGPLWFYPPAASPARWRGCRGPLGRHRSGFGPRTAPDCSLTFHLTKPRLLGVVYRQVCVRGRKGAAHAESATVRPPLPSGDSIPTKCRSRERAG